MAFKRWKFGWKPKEGDEDLGASGDWADQAEREAEQMIEDAAEAEDRRSSRGGVVQQSILHMVRVGRSSSLSCTW